MKCDRCLYQFSCDKNCDIRLCSQYIQVPYEYDEKVRTKAIDEFVEKCVEVSGFGLIGILGIETIQDIATELKGAEIK